MMTAPQSTKHEIRSTKKSGVIGTNRTETGAAWAASNGRIGVVVRLDSIVADSVPIVSDFVLAGTACHIPAI
jgi:hypothetical protein